MTQTPSFRDVEKLSAYLDGQLKPSETAWLEARLQTDPQLASILKDLRQTRGILRQLPQRRAPRNFTLTHKMVGQKPPMPRTYPMFQYASVLATLLLFFTFAANFMAPRLEPTTIPLGMGGYGGGGGSDAEPELAMEAQADEAMEEAAEPAAPAAEPEMPMAEAPMAPEGTAVPPMPAEGESAAEDSTRTQPTMQPNGVEKSAPGEAFAQDIAPEPEATVQEGTAPRPINANLQILLAGIAVLTAIVAFILRYITIRKWRAKAR